MEYRERKDGRLNDDDELVQKLRDLEMSLSAFTRKFLKALPSYSTELMCTYTYLKSSLEELLNHRNTRVQAEELLTQLKRVVGDHRKQLES